MKLEIKQGDVLEQRADVLICSANVFLNLSGGVGGEILRRHGTAMQLALHQHLSDRGIRFVARGEVVVTDGFGTGFKHVLHAVAVDGWYQSSAEVVGAVLTLAFKTARKLGAKSAAVVALATGYGRLNMNEFALGLREAAKQDFAPLEAISVILHREHEAAAVRDILGLTQT